MNVLPRDKHVAIVSALIEGASIRSVERMPGVHRDTIMRVLRRAGSHSARIMAEQVQGLRCREIQADELWTFCGKKERRLSEAERLNTELGDQYVWIALDPVSKLVASFAVGKRDAQSAHGFMADLASRFAPGVRVQVSTDGFNAYVGAVEDAFGASADYAQIVKVFASENPGPGRYSPPRVAEVVSTVISGKPNPDRIGTSHVERWNLSMRTQCRRFTRLTIGFSRSLANLKAATALAIASYNFVKVNRAIRMTPAMAAGLTNRVWDVEDLPS